MYIFEKLSVLKGRKKDWSMLEIFVCARILLIKQELWLMIVCILRRAYVHLIWSCCLPRFELNKNWVRETKCLLKLCIECILAHHKSSSFILIRFEIKLIFNTKIKHIVHRNTHTELFFNEYLKTNEFYVYSNFQIL